MAQATLRFRLLDGTDLGPFTFSLSTTVGALKEALVRDWPKEREPLEGPGALKLILAGRMLDSSMTLAEARTPSDMLVTVHLVVVAPPAKGKPPKTAPKAAAEVGTSDPSSGCCSIQ